MEKLKQLGLPETFCFAPYTNLDLDQDGTWYPCYRSKEPQGHWKEYDVTTTYNSFDIQKVRMDLWNGVFPENCRQCKERESNGTKSTRQEYNEHLLELADNLDFVNDIKHAPQFGGVENIYTMEVRPHSLCNLACGHCDEHSSSRWLKLKRLPKDKFTYHLIDNPEYLKTFYNKATNLKTVHFTGGEPLIYASSHKEWLAGITNKSDIELRYHTNLNHNRISSYSMEWDKFKHVKFFVSIDTSKRYYEYFRYGGDWNRMDHNLKYLKDKHEVVGIITVNFLTMLDLVSLVRYMVANDLQIHVAFVDPPHPMTIAYMSDQQKLDAMNQILQSEEELKYKEEWKVKRGKQALQKIKEFLETTWKTGKLTNMGKQRKEQIKHLAYLDKMYKMSWSEL